MTSATKGKGKGSAPPAPDPAKTSKSSKVAARPRTVQSTATPKKNASAGDSTVVKKKLTPIPGSPSVPVEMEEMDDEPLAGPSSAQGEDDPSRIERMRQLLEQMQSEQILKDGGDSSSSENEREISQLRLKLMERDQKVRCRLSLKWANELTISIRSPPWRKRLNS